MKDLGRNREGRDWKIYHTFRCPNKGIGPHCKENGISQCPSEHLTSYEFCPAYARQIMEKFDEDKK